LGKECVDCIGYWMLTYVRFRDLCEKYREAKAKGDVDWKELEERLQGIRDVLWKPTKDFCEFPSHVVEDGDDLFGEAIEYAEKMDDRHFQYALELLDNFLQEQDVRVALKCQRERER